ncbi:MAG: hypothetical protein JO214_15695 [Frankiaceae bacterium]|nr:hypothetical protein [Frankiaceae bacterium]
MAYMTAYQRKLQARNAEIVRLAKLKVPTKRIARLTGCSTSVVLNVKRANGIEADVTPPLTTEQLARAEVLLADGCSRAETARTLGVSKHQLRHAFPEAAWSTEDRVEAEHATGDRKHTAPVIAHSRRYRERARQERSDGAGGPFQ